MDFVDGLKGKLPDEELAVIKRYVEKRRREAAQTQVTVTPVNTVQHCSLCPPNPDMPSDVCFRLKSSEGKMGPQLKELESPSAGTGLETPGQQCPPNEGIWETGRTTANGILIAGVGSNQGGNMSSLTERAKNTENRRHKTTSEENKQLDPGGKGEKAPPWNAAVTLLSFLGRAGRLLACASCFLSVLCLFFVCALFF